MKRFWIMLLAVALALVIALPAGAGKPDNPGKPSPDEPDDTVGGFTCISDPYTDNIMFATNDFVIELGGRDTWLSSSACVDVLNAEAGLWRITVTGGGARSLALTPRDSHGPGDSCGGVSLTREEIYGQFTLPREIPIATVNACGEDNGDGTRGDFAEWIDENYPVGHEDLWDADAICQEATGDSNAKAPCGVSVELPNRSHPLVLQASFQGSKTATAKICVDLPPLVPDGGLPSICG